MPGAEAQVQLRCCMSSFEGVFLPQGSFMVTFQLHVKCTGSYCEFFYLDVPSTGHKLEWFLVLFWPISIPDLHRNCIIIISPKCHLCGNTTKSVDRTLTQDRDGT